MTDGTQGPSTRGHLYYSLFDYLIRKGQPESVECPEYPAVRVYASGTDEFRWVRCDDPVVLRGLRHVSNWENVNDVGKKLVHEVYKPDQPYTGRDIR